MCKYQNSFFFTWISIVTRAQISTPQGKRLLIAPSNQVFGLTVDQSTNRYSVVTTALNTQIPTALLDSKVPASAFASAADKLAPLISIPFSSFSTIIIYFWCHSNTRHSPRHLSTWPRTLRLRASSATTWLTLLISFHTITTIKHCTMLEVERCCSRQASLKPLWDLSHT